MALRATVLKDRLDIFGIGGIGCEYVEAKKKN
jgi:hypothetical protein